MKRQSMLQNVRQDRSWSPRLLRMSLAVVLLLVASESLSAQQDDPALRQRFLKAVADATRKLKEPDFSLLAKCRRESRLTSISPAWRAENAAAYAERNIDPMEVDVMGFECAFRGPLVLQTGLTGPSDDLEYVRARNHAYVFALQRAPNSQRNALQFVERMGSDPQVDAQIVEIEATVRGAAFAGYYLWSMALSDLIETDAFRIIRVYGVESETGPLVRVEFEYSQTKANNEPDMTFSDGYLVVDPNREWVLQEYGATVDAHISNSRSVVRVTLEYGDSVEGVPIATKLERKTIFPDDPGTTMEGLVTVAVVSKDVPEEEFYLSHYGLPEPTFERRWNGSWIVYPISGVAFLAMAYWIRRRRAG